MGSWGVDAQTRARGALRRQATEGILQVAHTSSCWVGRLLWALGLCGVRGPQEGRALDYDVITGPLPWSCQAGWLS